MAKPCGVRRMAALSALATLAVAATIMPVSTYASPAPSAAGAHLAGRTVITASHTARAIVELPRSVTLAYGRGLLFKGLSIDGPGRIVGLALISTRDSSRPGFVELRMRTCFTRGCTQSAPGQPDQLIETDWGSPPPPYGPSNDAPATFSLPAGSYQLSVYTDGAPIRISWRIPGLVGKATVQARLQQHSAQTSPPERAVVGTAAGAASSQASATGSTATDVSVLAFAHVVAGSAHVTSDTSWCIYDGNGPPGGVMTSGCPGGGGLAFDATYVTASYRGMSWGMSVGTGKDAAGRYFQGVDDSGIQAITDTHDTLMWADAGIPTQRK